MVAKITMNNSFFALNSLYTNANALNVAIAIRKIAPTDALIKELSMNRIKGDSLIAL